MTGAEIVLNWYHDYYKMNKIVPTSGEIESQLEMAIEEEKRENKSDIIDLVTRCYVKEIDQFYEDTGYSDNTSDWGVRKDNKRKNFWDFKLPSEMIKDWMKWKRNNA